MKKFIKSLAVVLVSVLALSSVPGIGQAAERTDVIVFIAASLGKAMDRVKADYEAKYPGDNIIYNKDSSGRLMSQIRDGGAACDVFFSAAQGKMDRLEKDGLLVDGSRRNLVGNTLILITGSDMETEVTGLDTISHASSIALADGTVPVGKYTRIAMVADGLIKADKKNAAKITTREVSEALGGVEISEQSNVSKVLAAVMEESCEVGTVYYSGTYGVSDKIRVIEKISHDLTGPIVYPIALVKNDEADDAERASAKRFLDYVSSDEGKAVFAEYLFDTDVK